jgi:hypothetical protein
VVTTNPTTADNCAVTRLTWTITGATTASSPATGINNVGTATFNTGVSTVTYTVRDAAGNTATCSYTVTVVDNINPTIACPANITANVGAGSCVASVATPNPVTADNCAVTVLTWAMTGATTANSAATGINNVGIYTFNLGTTTVAYTVTDVQGNTASCSYTVTVNDNINPTISCPSNVTANVGAGTCVASVVTTNPTTADNCSVTTLTWAMTGATVATSPATGINNVGTYTFNLGTTTVTYTVRDAAGNSATCSYTVTVIDNINPTISCPSNVTANVTAGLCNASVVTTNPVTADNCSVTTLTWAMTGATVAASSATGINHVGTYVFNTGLTTVTYTVRDAAGNTATCSFTVTIVDNINPTILCPSNITANVGAGTCVASVVTPNAVTADNCAVTRLTWAMTGATVATSAATGINNVGTYTFNLGTTTVTYTVRDAAGNTATCSYTVTVIDNINPTIGCPANISVGTDNGVCTANVTVPAPTTADNCSVASVINNFNGTSNASGVYPIGTTTVVWTVTDGSGNTATCSMTVTVADDENPQVTCPGNQNVNFTGSCNFTLPNYTLVSTTTDNCSSGSSLVLTQSPSPGTVVSGNTTVTITSTDAAGNA